MTSTPSSSGSRRISVLGTGRMGSALASAFLAGGHAVTVWNRTAARAKPLEAKGARLAASVEEAVAETEIVVGNVSDYAGCAALLAPPAVTRALRGKLLLQLTTGTPSQARETAAWAADHHIPYLDGAIMATPDFVGQPECTILYAGAPDLFAAHKPTLSALGGNLVFAGANLGHANALDSALLTVLWGSCFGVFQAAAICEAEAFPLDVFSSSLEATMPVIASSLKDAVDRISTRRFKGDATTLATVETCHASVRLIDQISREHGIHAGLSAALDKLFSRARDAGHNADDLAAVYLGMRD